MYCIILILFNYILKLIMHIFIFALEIARHLADSRGWQFLSSSQNFQSLLNSILKPSPNHYLPIFYIFGYLLCLLYFFGLCGNFFWHISLVLIIKNWNVIQIRMMKKINPKNIYITKKFQEKKMEQIAFITEKFKIHQIFVRNFVPNLKNK